MSLCDEEAWNPKNRRVQGEKAGVCVEAEDLLPIQPAGYLQICISRNPAWLTDTFLGFSSAASRHGDSFCHRSCFCRMLQQCDVSGASDQVSHTTSAINKQWRTCYYCFGIHAEVILTCLQGWKVAVWVLNKCVFHVIVPPESSYTRFTMK